MNVLLGLFLIVVGLVSIFNPKLGWWLSDGWKYKDVEPSGCAMFAQVVGGIIAVIFGLVVVFTGAAQG